MEKKKLDKLQELLSAYGDEEAIQIQDPQEASTDSQLKCLTLIVEDVLSTIPQGTVLDIGCGKGIFLSKLKQLSSFYDNPKWYYLGVDYDYLHDSLLELAAHLRLHRRCEVIGVSSLYDSWIENVDTPRPLLVMARNLLHELDISKTAQLFHLLCKYLTSDDVLLVQDLLVFPKAERGHVCWDSDCLKQVFIQLGFDISLVAEPSRSGSQWFSAKITKRDDVKSLTEEDVCNIVANGRLKQLQKWRSASSLTLNHPDSRLTEIAIIDFDLQKSALYQQLDTIGFLSIDQQQSKLTPNPAAAMQLFLSSYNPAVLDCNQIQFPSINNFRDRAHSQDALEHFLNSNDSVVVIRGGTLCGKSALVSHVLSRRVHSRSTVLIDCKMTDDIWPMLEQYLLSIGCCSSLEILNHEKVSFEVIKKTIDELVQSVSQRIIIVFDHFEHLLDPNGQIMNPEICQFLTLLAVAEAAKVIITTRKDPILEFLPELTGVNTEQPPVGRFPRGEHVENLLDDYVDRAALGLEKYPYKLLEAIDRFPYLATLAGKLIAESGIAVAEDPELQKIIKSYLYDEIIKRIITPEAKPALQLASLLRIPAPKGLFEGVVGKETTNNAVETGLLFNIPDRYHNDLLTCPSILRESETEFDSLDDDINIELDLVEKHAEIAKWYIIFSEDGKGDPRWIREAHYHTLASGISVEIEKFGSLYKGELFWAARAWFRRFRNYENALEALFAAEKMGFCTYETRKLTAACLVRIGKREDGESRYRALISDFPNQEGIKTSFVDSLLRIGEFNDALSTLEEFELPMYNSNPWIIGQYGRAYLGLHNYLKATEAFKLQLRRYVHPPAIVYVRLAQSYFRSGERDKAQATVEEGLKMHKEDLVLSTLYCANLLKGSSSDLEKAKQLLANLADMYPRNGYVLQKFVTATALLGDPSEAIARLDKINWQIDPPRLKIPVQITVFLAQHQFRRALEAADNLPVDDEYGQAIMRKIFLFWANEEQTIEGKRRIAMRGLEREIPRSCQNNIPVLAMYAQLARIATDDTRFNQVFKQIHILSPKIAKYISDEINLFDRWDDYEPDISEL